MLSRLLHKVQADAAELFIFPQTVKAFTTSRGIRPSSQHSQSPHGESQDLGQLRARVAELELMLTEQAATIRKDAHREGEASGRAKAEAALKALVERLGRTTQQVLDSKPRMRKQIEEEAVQLSLAISRRILRRELSIDPSALHGLVQAAFDRVARQETTRVIVHPDQAAQVRDALAGATTRNIEVVADGSRESGTLIFETTRGSVDASLDSQLREIELGLADRLKWR